VHRPDAGSQRNAAAETPGAGGGLNTQASGAASDTEGGIGGKVRSSELYKNEIAGVSAKLFELKTRLIERAAAERERAYNAWGSVLVAQNGILAAEQYKEKVEADDIIIQADNGRTDTEKNASTNALISAESQLVDAQLLLIKARAEALEGLGVRQDVRFEIDIAVGQSMKTGEVDAATVAAISRDTIDHEALTRLAGSFAGDNVYSMVDDAMKGNPLTDLLTYNGVDFAAFVSAADSGADSSIAGNGYILMHIIDPANTNNVALWKRKVENEDAAARVTEDSMKFRLLTAGSNYNYAGIALDNAKVAYGSAKAAFDEAINDTSPEMTIWRRIEVQTEYRTAIMRLVEAASAVESAQQVLEQLLDIYGIDKASVLAHKVPDGHVTETRTQLINNPELVGLATEIMSEMFSMQKYNEAGSAFHSLNSDILKEKLMQGRLHALNAPHYALELVNGASLADLAARGEGVTDANIDGLIAAITLLKNGSISTISAYGDAIEALESARSAIGDDVQAHLDDAAAKLAVGLDMDSLDSQRDGIAAYDMDLEDMASELDIYDMENGVDLLKAALEAMKAVAGANADDFDKAIAALADVRLEMNAGLDNQGIISSHWTAAQNAFNDALGGGANIGAVKDALASYINGRIGAHAATIADLKTRLMNVAYAPDTAGIGRMNILKVRGIIESQTGIDENTRLGLISELDCVVELYVAALQAAYDRDELGQAIVFAEIARDVIDNDVSQNAKLSAAEAAFRNLLTDMGNASARLLQNVLSELVFAKHAVVIEEISLLDTGGVLENAFKGIKADALAYIEETSSAIGKLERKLVDEGLTEDEARQKEQLEALRTMLTEAYDLLDDIIDKQIISYQAKIHAAQVALYPDQKYAAADAVRAAVIEENKLRSQLHGIMDSIEAYIGDKAACKGVLKSVDDRAITDAIRARRAAEQSLRDEMAFLGISAIDITDEILEGLSTYQDIVDYDVAEGTTWAVKLTELRQARQDFIDARETVQQEVGKDEPDQARVWPTAPAPH